MELGATVPQPSWLPAGIRSPGDISLPLLRTWFSASAIGEAAYNQPAGHLDLGHKAAVRFVKPDDANTAAPIFD